MFTVTTVWNTGETGDKYNGLDLVQKIIKRGRDKSILETEKHRKKLCGDKKKLWADTKILGKRYQCSLNNRIFKIFVCTFFNVL